MSASDSPAAKPDIRALGRVASPPSPGLKSCSCLARYSACWPAMIGLAAVGLLPSAPWHATQTVAAICSPAARSGPALSCAVVTAGSSEMARPTAVAATTRVMAEARDNAGNRVGEKLELWGIANPIVLGSSPRIAGHALRQHAIVQ